VRFTHTTTARYTAERLFTTYRDHLVAIAPLIPSVNRVELRSRTQLAGGEVELAHLWHGTSAAVPAFVRPFVQPEMLRWIDHTRWDHRTLTASWRIELPAVGPAVKATGTYVFEDVGGSGRVVAQGDLSLDASMLPPAMVAAKPMIERMVVGLLEPMIEDAGDAVVRWLDQTSA
jgi:hypothetical protein